MPGDLSGVVAGTLGEDGRGFGNEVRERVHLEVGPELFRGVELGRVGRQRLGADTRPRPEELLDRDGTVAGKKVPHEDDGASDVAQEIFQERDHLPRRDVLVRIESEEKAGPLPNRRQRDRGGHRDLLVRAPRLVEDRRGTAGSPCFPDHGGHHQPALVEEGDVRLPPRSVFFTRGTFFSTHRAIAASSRSLARRSGFWGLNPIFRRSRPI